MFERNSELGFNKVNICASLLFKAWDPCCNHRIRFHSAMENEFMICLHFAIIQYFLPKVRQLDIWNANLSLCILTELIQPIFVSNVTGWVANDLERVLVGIWFDCFAHDQFLSLVDCISVLDLFMHCGALLRKYRLYGNFYVWLRGENKLLRDNFLLPPGTSFPTSRWHHLSLRGLLF